MNRDLKRYQSYLSTLDSMPDETFLEHAEDLWLVCRMAEVIVFDDIDTLATLARPRESDTILSLTAQDSHSMTPYELGSEDTPDRWDDHEEGYDPYYSRPPKLPILGNCPVCGQSFVVCDESDCGANVPF